jgi:hypothetical protein
VLTSCGNGSSARSAGSTCGGCSKKGISPAPCPAQAAGYDPQRPAILRRLRFQWRHRPRGGILGFFDVQPITVKAYGGRRYTRERRLVLARNQKTRGRFYLFTFYEVNQGRTRWAFFTGKGARFVCQFLRRLRRWYGTKNVRVALDRDPAHPCKAEATRRLMRSLHLGWTSLPKRSPDDNPVETIFSDVQQRVLDDSNDADARTTQRRISRHLQARNRRPDRFMRIGYLKVSHKK